MDLNHDAQLAFTQFCILNNKLWTEIYPAHQACSTSGIILVDLFHDQPNYLLRNLLIAKYLECSLDVKVIGLLGEPGAVKKSCPKINPAITQELAQSFGITEFWIFPEISDESIREADYLLNKITADLPSPPPQELLRYRLKTLELSNGFPIGRFIYDTTIRSELCATIKEVNTSLKKWTAHALALSHWMDKCLEPLNELHPIYFVTGHLDYNPWGLIAEKICRIKGEVFWFRPDNNVPLYNIKRSPQSEQTLNAIYNDLETEWFKNVIWPNHNKYEAGQKAYEAGNATRAFYQRWTTHNYPDVPNTIASFAAHDWKISYGWNPNTPVVGVFAHAYADQPVADLQLYDDRYVWLAETLAFAEKHPGRNWVIKLHPRDLDYDSANSSHDLMERYANIPHIQFVQGEVAFNVIQTLCDVGVTIFGFPGLQMAAAGKPVITAGNGPYTECGFVHRPRTIAEYHKLLLTDPNLLQITTEQVERARLYEYANAFAGTPSSSFFEPTMRQSNRLFWEKMCVRISNHNLLGDDLYLGISMLLANRYGRIRHPFPERYYLAIPIPSSQDTKDLTTLTNGRSICFSSREPEKAYRICGFDSSISWGMWAIAETARLMMHIDLDISEDNVLLLDYKSVPRPFGFSPLTVSIYINNHLGCHRQYLRKKGTLHLALPENLNGKSLIMLKFVFHNLLPLSLLRLSENDTSYALALMTARLSQRSELERHLTFFDEISSRVTAIAWRASASVLYMWRCMVLKHRQSFMHNKSHALKFFSK